MITENSCRIYKIPGLDCFESRSIPKASYKLLMYAIASLRIISLVVILLCLNNIKSEGQNDSCHTISKDGLQIYP